MGSPLTIRDVARFFWPLAFTAELMMVSHTIIHAALARMGHPTETLAAFSIASSVHTILAAPTVITPFTALAFLRDRQSLLALLWFHGLVILAPITIMLAVGLTPLGDFIFGQILGASPGVTNQARHASLIFMLIPPIIALRAMPTALLMLNRRTIDITYATMVRLITLVGLLAFIPRLVSGAPAGVWSLVLCIGVETIFLYYVARDFLYALPKKEGQSTLFGEVWSFAWPLLSSQIAESSMALVTNIFIGRLARADLALAAYGVVRGLAMLLLTPLRTMAQTAQTLVRSRGVEEFVLIRFTLIAVTVASGIILVLFWSPIRPWILGGVMGLPDNVSAYCSNGVRTMLLVPMFWGYAALFRGLLSGLRRTKVIGLSSIVKLAAVVSVGAWALYDIEANGTVIGMAALAAAAGGESLLLGWWLFSPKGAGR